MTSSGNQRPPDSEEVGRFFIVSDEEMERLAISLTVIQGYGQLMRRRILRDPTSRRDDIEPLLAQLEDATRSIVTHYHKMIGILPHAPGDTDPD